MTEVVEYGLQWDCQAEGCDPHHDVEHRVFWVSTDRRDLPDKTDRGNPHATRLVRRTITYSPWEPVEDPAHYQEEQTSE